MNHPPLRTARLALAAVVALGILAACGPEQSGSGDQGANRPGTGQPGGEQPQGTNVPGAETLKACPSTTSRPPATNSLPDVSLPCLGEGPDIRLADLRGPLVLNVWAQWCGPCRDEAPYLAELQKKAGAKVQLLGIDYADPRPELAVQFATEHGLDYPHVVDQDKTTQQALKIGGPPLTAFIDKDGAVVFVHRGVLTSQNQLDQLVKEKLGVTW
ncbi:MAG TPA: TlpA disulfide reductase family protein [Kribbella sp.]|uniref:TlpA family protein disulfide reductase n=1 Tax=Kribbella sp. TaxID=1871183 RepID=UPI002D7767C1|nr:TlpA disulfide reductase family protein [Kribbella sp.]HET6296792.1 TlpA disulfide reductase family protein [Kribbella sp.]